MKDFTASVIISTYNSPKYLAVSLQSFLNQTVMPKEVLISDDGSGEETRKLIDDFRKRYPVPLIHVWHEDEGFRKAAITNKAIAAASTDYVIVIDGDMIYDRHLVEDHLRHARPGYFLCGSQVRLKKRTTEKIFRSDTLRIPFGVRLTVPNAWRIPWLTPWMMKHYKQGEKYKYRTVRGGHMSIWRKDMITVNGYDEDFVGWGFEDTELGVRLRHAGFKMLNLKMGAVIYHLYHSFNSRASADENRRRVGESIQQNKVRCENGIDKYLK